MHPTITAEQARNNAAGANYGTEQILLSISSSISANSKQGKRSITQSVSREIASDGEVKGAEEALLARGFEVTRVGTTLAHVTLQISW